MWQPACGNAVCALYGRESGGDSDAVSLSIFDENRNPVVLCVCGMLSDGDSASICQNTKIEGAKTASSYQNDP